MSKTHLEILVQGVATWNRWRRDHPKTAPELIGANLRDQDLTGVDLRGADLREADLFKAYLSRADLSEANLREADLGETNLSGAKLTKAYLYKVRLNAANLGKADLSGAELFGADLTEANLREAKLNAAFLSRAALRGANLNRADLRAADLRAADLGDTNLSRADLSRADLRNADCAGANLTDAILNHAQLTGAVLWDTQRAGWSIFEASCDYAFWEPNGRRRLNYAPGEFERLYTSRTQIALSYPGGMSEREFAILPLLLRALQRGLREHSLLLRRVEDNAGDTTLTLEFEDESAIEAEERPRLKEIGEEQGAALIARQREALAAPDRTSGIDRRLAAIEAELFPPDPASAGAPQEQEAAGAAPAGLPDPFGEIRYPISLFLDLDTHPEPEPPAAASGRPHGLTDTLLQQVPHSFTPDGGESAVIAFDTPLEGIRFALAYLHSIGERRHQAPATSGEGPALVSYSELTEGPPAAPATGPGEVLVSEALRHHPEVALDQDLVFLPVERKVRKAFGDKQAGDTIRCFLVQA